MTDSKPAELDRCLEEALRRALRAPQVPNSLRARLSAALARSADADWATVRERLEREAREQLETLKVEYVRIRRGTLVTLLGAAFAAGISAVIAMPWLRAHLGVYAPMAIAWGGAALGVGITFYAPLRAALRRWSDAL